MRKLIILPFAFFSIVLFAQTTNIPDVNFEERLIFFGYDNGTPDGSVLTANIVNVTHLDVYGRSISDLTGIEDFTALIELNCGNNLLTNLNVSQNTALTMLACQKNQLISLDLSQNLTELHCHENQLSNLNVSSCTLLSYLNCQLNQLANLDFTQNPSLTFLACGGNNLSNLDIYQNTSLEQLYCWSNLLSNIDVSVNNQLTLLNCSFNMISSLDLSQNTSLYSLNCESNTLNCLNVNNGNNSNFWLFDATTNPNLTCIEVDDTIFSTANWIDIDSNAVFRTNCANECSSSITRLEETASSSINLFPNPTQSSISLTHLQLVDQIHVYDMYGNEVYSNTSPESILNINLGQFGRAGVYMIQVNSFVERVVLYD